MPNATTNTRTRPPESPAAVPKPKPTPEFWRVYNRIARAWYEQEYGRVEYSERWYEPAMLFLQERSA